MAFVKSYATSTLLLWVVHHYFILNHATSIAARGASAFQLVGVISSSLVSNS